LVYRFTEDPIEPSADIPRCRDGRAAGFASSCAAFAVSTIAFASSDMNRSTKPLSASDLQSLQEKRLGQLQA
jgi:hypothetical protein